MAKNETGRAGRTTAGVCFHLCSRRRFESLREFRESELLTTPLEELCLQAKARPFVFFFTNQPPNQLTIRFLLVIVNEKPVWSTHAPFPFSPTQPTKPTNQPTNQNIKNSCWASPPASTPWRPARAKTAATAKNCRPRRRPGCGRGRWRVREREGGVACFLGIAGESSYIDASLHKPHNQLLSHLYTQINIHTYTLLIQLNFTLK